ncbi:phosphonoacetaldehyde hydrolase [Rhodococcoides trifolii]|uniref:Phosphonoacetaldehyde hydrolase n=1 Tax=Rhodococcoides trifolii TaxID=908250 RepID=A0A917G5Z9_9NOCA|nr:phosphonatase-like hydrolase [Rhodococcus trifolii]GGG24106.1 phosphonoacetaldehyde hydrolase [Rhodococcus trifolii]
MSTRPNSTGLRPTRPFDLVSLDMAGTTVDEGGLVYEVLAATVVDAAGRPLPDVLLSQWKGTSKKEAIAGLLHGLDADDVSVESVFEDFRSRLITAYRTNPPKPVAGVPEALADLRANGVKVALQTGYSADIADAILEGMGWAVGDTVDALVTSDMVPASRPAPYLVFRTMEATGIIDVRRVLVAGDTPNDILAGHNAGAGFVVGVLSGSFGEEELAKTPLTHLLPSLAEIGNVE